MRAGPGEGDQHPHDRIPTLAIGMVVGALALGTAIAWTVLHTRAQSELDRRGNVLPATTFKQVDPAVAIQLVDRGGALVLAQCAGCHAPQERLAGPSWSAIADRYRSLLKRDPFCGSGLALMASATAHPSPGWDGFGPGPENPAVSAQDRVALAAWILRRGSVKATGQFP